MLNDYEARIFMKALEQERYRRQRMGKVVKAKGNNASLVTRGLQQAQAWGRMWLSFGRNSSESAARC